MASNIGYLLIESNRIKLGGYETISINFLNSLVDFLYSGVKQGQFLKSKYYKLSKDGYLNINSISGTIHKDKRLVTSQENSMLSKIYLRAYRDDNYAELVFILFLVGCVNTKDLFARFTDIGFLISKFSKNSATPKLRTENQGYRELMACLIENTSEGIDYGFSVYDFIYHIRVSAGKHPLVVLAILKSLKIGSWGCFRIENEEMLKKYVDEIAYVLPLIADTGLISSDVMVYVLSSVSYGIQSVILKDKMFVEKIYKDCVEVM